MYRCPKDPTHDSFYAKGRESHDYIVDRHGNIEKDIECYDSSIDEVTTCVKCGAEAIQGDNFVY